MVRYRPLNDSFTMISGSGGANDYLNSGGQITGLVGELNAGT